MLQFTAMSTFVLIHGAWHGAWCWRKVSSRLEKLGHRVIAPDLPGLGDDRTPVERVSLQLWTRYVCGILDAETEPVILVGHSRGGIVISEVAEQRPDKIRALVYLTAFLVRDGECLFDLAQQAVSSLIAGNMVMSPDKLCSTVREEFLREGFYGLCPEEDVELARSLLRPEPTAPLATPVRVTAENFGRVPRIYIQCLQDRAVPQALQKQMYSASPCREVRSLDTDHSPFFSAPDELTTHLHELAS
jgi:pimeloyl-ACP methyl ester carboxylesterase